METPTPRSVADSLPLGYRGVRGEILLELKRATAELTARDLVEILGASLNAVRHHLKEMEAEGILTHRREQRGVGAPVHVYQLSAAGENLFPRRYDVLLTETLASLEGMGGRPAVVEAMEDRYNALALRLQAELAGAPAPQRLETVARILAEEGYMADWNASNGAVSLTEHNCAIKAVAQRFPEICEAEERFLREVLAANVERRTHILTGCHACEYSIHFPEAGPDGDSAPLSLTRRPSPAPLESRDA
jgi:DeoR family transcriptional regulator, suf operon transcriptional repressor